MRCCARMTSRMEVQVQVPNDPGLEVSAGLKRQLELRVVATTPYCPVYASLAPLGNYPSDACCCSLESHCLLSTYQVYLYPEDRQPGRTHVNHTEHQHASSARKSNLNP